ncbi:MAG TPA: 2-C-methyl-D-erythritol 4-phosphate cytidylyltransferase [Bacteroidales bacterium]|jgi:2-C-methyl-D-erythritol 4-phosphate cytidylyltransferase|nr:2-C-methyl-D-erythritol 4-phosphate cytidylyltransferase [Bacteroidales bacterium]
MQDHLIVVAGGKGLRMGGELPKQFLELQGKPLLMHTLETFHRHRPDLQFILALPADQRQSWDELCRRYRFALPIQTVNGGETRFHSVWNALSCVENEDGCTGVHDGVRPFVTPDTIAASYEAARQYGAAIPVVAPVDSIRELLPQGSTARPRDQYRLVQTPQVFQTRLLKKAYEQDYKETFTDDASVVEALGHPIHLVAGNPENIKITTPFDLILAEALLHQKG